MPAFFRNERRPVSSEEVAALAPRVAFLGSFFLDMAFSCFTRIYDSEPPPKRPRRSSPKPQLQRRSHDRRLRSGKPNTYRTAIRRRRGRLGNAVASLLRPPTIAAGAVNGRWPPPQPAPQPAYLRVGGRSAGP